MKEPTLKLKYIFRIHGNQEDAKGNPIPFQRVLAHKMRKASVRYMHWQQYVKAEFLSSLQFVDSRFIGKHPIVLEKDQKARVDIIIGWANETHGDCDNVFKGICDALFENDKHLEGSFTYIHTEDHKGFVDVNIWIYDTPEVVGPVKRKSKKKLFAG